MIKRILALTGGTLIILAAALLYVHTAHAPSSPLQQQPATNQKPVFDKKRYSTTDPTSLWVIVNKQHPLAPKTYVPASLVVPNVPLRSNITGDEQQVSGVIAPALEAMVAAAKSNGITLNVQSGYRSYGFQVSLYNSYVSRDGQTKADQYSARPGYSEHQSGLAVDLGGITSPSCNVNQCFETTPEGKWLAVHAYEYGFIIRYPADRQSVTGYEYEPWHVRYVGKELAGEMHQQGIETLEEFFGVTGGEQY